MKERLVETISCFVDLKHIDGIMLTGSYAENLVSTSSDVDIILVSKLINRAVHETIVYNERKYQLLFFPYFKATYILMEDALKGEGVYISMLKKGIIISDDSSFLLKRLKAFAERGGTCISEHEILNLQNFITKNLEDLQEASTEAERLFCAIDILKYTTQLLSGKIQSTGKHLGRATGDSETSLSELVDTFNTFTQTKDPSSFVSATERLLTCFGSSAAKHTSDYVWIVPPERQVMVFFPNHTIFQNEVCKIIADIINLCSECSCHSFYIGKNQLMEDGVYLAIYSEQQKSEFIFERINEYRKAIIENNIRKDIRMSFPYKTLYFEGLYFGGEEVFKKLLPYYESISNFVLKTIIAEEDVSYKRNVLLLLATDFLLRFVKTVFNTEADKHQFLNDYCESLLPEAVDPNALYNINQLPDIKEAALNYYESVFTKNKPQLLKLSTADNLTDIDNYESLRDLYRGFFEAIAHIDIEPSAFNSVWNAKETKQILMTNIANHTLSLFHLNPIEKFSITYNVTKFTEL